MNHSALARWAALLPGAMLLLMATKTRGAETNGTPPLAKIPIEFHQGSALVRVKVNDSQSLSFKLDTGFGVTTIHPDLAESLGLKRTGTMTIVGIAGREQAAAYSGVSFDFGGVQYSPRRVVSLPSDAQRRRRNRDGILGAGLFRRFVVELDPVAQTLALFEPTNFTYAGRGEILPFAFRQETPIVEASINFTNREPVRGKFEIDSGCDGELCLGHDFVEANRLDGAADADRTESRRGVGGSVETRAGVLPQFQLGSLKLDRLPANFFLEGSPVDDGLAGHIGMGTLRKFRVIFDYSRRRMILAATQ